MLTVCAALLLALALASATVPEAMSGMESADWCVQDTNSCALELIQRRAVMMHKHRKEGRKDRGEDSSNLTDQDENDFQGNGTEYQPTNGKEDSNTEHMLPPIDWYDPVGEDEDEEEKEMREKGYVDEDGNREADYEDEGEDMDAEEEDYDDDLEDANPYEKTAEQKARERKEEEEHWAADTDIDPDNREDFEIDSPFPGPVSERKIIYEGYNEDTTAAWSPWTEQREKESLNLPDAEPAVQASMFERPEEQIVHPEAEPTQVAMVKKNRKQFKPPSPTWDGGKFDKSNITLTWFDWKTKAGFKKGGKIFTHKASTSEKRPAVFFLKSAIAQWVLKDLLLVNIDWVAGYSMCAHPRCKRGRNKKRCCWSSRYTKMFVLWMTKNGGTLGIDPKRISLFGYSGGAVVSASAGKELGGDAVKSVILLNGGLNTMVDSKRPLPSYLCIIGKKDFPLWLRRDRKMYSQLQEIEGYENKVELDIGHCDWPLEQEAILGEVKNFLLAQG